MVAGDEHGTHAGAGLRGRVAVVDDKGEVFAEVVETRPAVQLFPLVGAHEPEQLCFGVLQVPVLSDSPAPAGRGKL